MGGRLLVFVTVEFAKCWAYGVGTHGAPYFAVKPHAQDLETQTLNLSCAYYYDSSAEAQAVNASSLRCCTYKPQSPLGSPDGALVLHTPQIGFIPYLSAPHAKPKPTPFPPLKIIP